MDTSCNIFHEIMVEREGFPIQIEVVYEWLPDFCSHCKTIGHNVSICRCLHSQQSSKDDKKRIDKGNKGKKLEKPRWQTSQAWQAKDNPVGIGSSKAFEMPIAQNIPFQVAENIAAQTELSITGDTQPLIYEAQTTVEYE